MIYLKDNMTSAVRKFDDKIPKEKRKADLFLKKAKSYKFDSEENKIEAARGGRWSKATKADYDKWVKETQS